MMSILLVSGIAMLGIGAPAPKDGKKIEQPSILGEWLLESIVHQGRTIHDDDVRYTFTSDGKVVFTHPGGTGPEQTYTVGEKKEVTDIDMFLPNPGGPCHRLGIYKFDGDKLILSLNRVHNGDRPTTFESPKGKDVMLMTFKRVQKKK